MIMIIILWLVLSCSVGLFFAMMVTMNIKKKAVRVIITGAIALVFGGMLISISFLECGHDDEVWNSGYCECGGNWRLVDVVHYRNGGDKFYYECEDCLSSIYTNNQMR